MITENLRGRMNIVSTQHLARFAIGLLHLCVNILESSNQSINLFLRYVTVEGKPIHKATVLRDVTQNGHQLSSDRLRRVRGLSRYPDINDATDEVDSILIGDPCHAKASAGQKR